MRSKQSSLSTARKGKKRGGKVKAEIPEGIERFRRPGKGMQPNPEGGFVRYSDHLAKVEEEREIRLGREHDLEIERHRADHAEQLLAEAREEFLRRAQTNAVSGGLAEAAYKDAAQFLASQGGEECSCLEGVPNSVDLCPVHSQGGEEG
jgi:hypothetical protein